MKLQSPFAIGSRLLPSITVGTGADSATLSLEFVGCRSNRMVFRWYVDFADGQEFSGADLSSGIQGCTTQEMFATFLSFLSACGEGLRYQESTGRESESADLFPPPVAEWARQFSDELGMLQMEIEESGAALIED